MAFPALVEYDSEGEYRAHFEQAYCRGRIITFDSIAVRFRKHNFDHCFFESSSRDGVKDQFSLARAQRIDWIWAALQDPSAELYEGWDRNKKRHDRSRRVAIVLGNYVVVIHITRPNEANFVTAYVADTPGTPARPLTTLDQVRKGPRWK